MAIKQEQKENERIRKELGRLYSLGYKGENEDFAKALRASESYKKIARALRDKKGYIVPIVEIRQSRDFLGFLSLSSQPLGEIYITADSMYDILENLPDLKEREKLAKYKLKKVSSRITPGGPDIDYIIGKDPNSGGLIWILDEERRKDSAIGESETTKLMLKLGFKKPNFVRLERLKNF